MKKRNLIITAISVAVVAVTSFVVYDIVTPTSEEAVAIINENLLKIHAITESIDEINASCESYMESFEYKKENLSEEEMEVWMAEWDATTDDGTALCEIAFDAFKEIEKNLKYIDDKETFKAANKEFLTIETKLVETTKTSLSNQILYLESYTDIRSIYFREFLRDMSDYLEKMADEMDV